MEDIILYFTSNKEKLERELTQLTSSWSSDCDELLKDTQLATLKQTYKDQLLQTVPDTTNDVLYYCQYYLDVWFRESVEVMYNLHLRRSQLEANMVHLKRLDLPEQRSTEWYKIRENLLTASSLADALGKGHFQTRDGLLLSKISDTKSTFSKASRDIMQWGVKYEPVATEFYEYLNHVNIIEFGLIPHPELSVFGASPDGICDIGSPIGYTGRMLEIKCPPKRKFTKEVPKHYWMQMQGQLEVCDLDECDFFQVKLDEYDNVGDYEEDQLLEDECIQHGKTKAGLPKGLLIAYTSKDSEHIDYKYSPWLAPLQTIVEWRDKVLQELEVEHVIYEIKWWSIERYECTLVRRDKAWWLSVVPDIIQFWKEVVHYREVGNEEVQKRIDGRKRGPRKKVFEIKEPLKGYLIDSDED
jgi:putative phage-type endonuclease